jgi:hypothetical protein
MNYMVTVHKKLSYLVLNNTALFFVLYVSTFVSLSKYDLPYILEYNTHPNLIRTQVLAIC